MPNNEVIAGTLIVALSLALLWHFSNIVRYGGYTIQEPNSSIRNGESAGLIAILGFGIYCFVIGLKK